MVGNSLDQLHRTGPFVHRTGPFVHRTGPFVYIFGNLGIPLCKERSHEAYAKNYSMVFPHDEPLAGRNMKKVLSLVAKVY